MCEDGRCNLEIILDQLGFQDSVGRVQDLIEVRQLYLPLADLR